MKSLAVGIGHAVLAKGILLISQSAYTQYGESLPTHHETTREIGAEINRETTRGLPTPCVRFDSREIAGVAHGRCPWSSVCAGGDSPRSQ